MQPRYSVSCRRFSRAAEAAASLRAALVASALSMSAALGGSPAAAQGTDVAYVETVKGIVTAASQGGAVPLDILDIVSDQARLDLPAKSELRICHHRLRKLVTLKGPLRVTVSASGVTTEGGSTISPSAEICAAPVISTFQGGIVSRSVALPSTKVPLRPSIKVVTTGGKPVRKIVLWDAGQQKALATFDRDVARPKLDEGRSYLLIAERADGSELKMTLEASAGAKTGPVILVAR
jgi:hypothetical protein